MKNIKLLIAAIIFVLLTFFLFLGCASKQSHNIDSGVIDINLKYKDAGTLKAMIGFTSKIEEGNGPKDCVNVFYGLDFPQTPIGGKITYWYSVVVESEGNEIISHRDIITEIPVPKKYLIIDSDTIWDEFVTNAKNIDTKLAKDISNK